MRYAGWCFGIVISVSLLGLFAGSSLAQTPERSGVGWSYRELDLDVRVDPEGGRIEVKGRMRLELERERSYGPSLGLNSRNAILTWTRLDAPEGATVVLNEVSAGSPARRMADVRFETPLERGATLELEFAYESEGSSMQAIFTTEIVLASWVEAWHPVPLPAQGEALSAKMAAPGLSRFDLPRAWHAVSNGRRVAREEKGDRVIDTWRVETPVARSFCAAEYTVGTETVDGREMGVYLLSEDTTRADDQVGALAGALRAMEARFGPYPYPSYAIAEVPFWIPPNYGWGASSEQGFIMAMTGFVQVEGGNLPLFAHEAAHGWWGNLVNTTGPGSILCSESLAQYGAVIAIETVEGKAAATEFLRFSRPGYVMNQCAKGYFQLVREGQDLPLAQLGNGGVHHTLSDAKGHWVYHMIRRRLGDEVFFGALRGLLERFGGRRMALADVRRAFIEAAAPGDEMEAFLSQWLDRTGAPVLELRHEAGAVTILQTQEGEPYELRVDVEVETESGTRERFAIPVRERSTPVRLPEGARPESAVLDPDHAVLRWDPAYGPKPGIDAGQPVAAKTPSPVRERLANPKEVLPGHWMGVVSIGGEVGELGLRWVEVANGSLSAELAIPHLGLYGLPLAIVSVEDGGTVSLRLEHEMLGSGTFTAHVVEDPLTFVGRLSIADPGGQQKTGIFALVRIDPRSDEALARLAGTWKVERLGTVEISVEERTRGPSLLRAYAVSLGSRALLYPVAPHTYVFGLEPGKPEPIEVTFRFAADGRSVTIDRDGEQLPGRLEDVTPP